MATLIWTSIDTFLSRLQTVQRCYDQNGDGLIYSLAIYDYLYPEEEYTIEVVE